MGDAAAVGGGGSAPGLQVTSNQPQIPVTTFSSVHHPAMFRGHWTEDETIQCLRDPDSPKSYLTDNYSGMGRQGPESTRAFDLEGSLPGVADGPTLVH